MRILHIDNIMIRRYGNTKVTTGRKLFNGLIRNNHKVLEFSDRDIGHYEAPFNIKPLGFRRSNQRLVEPAKISSLSSCYWAIATSSRTKPCSRSSGGCPA